MVEGGRREGGARVEGGGGPVPGGSGVSRCEHLISCTPRPEAGPAVTAAVTAHGSPVSRCPRMGQA